MGQQRISDCWYIGSCEEDCDRCVTYTQMKYQMTNSGLPEAQQKLITLSIYDENKVDRNAFRKLANIRKNIVDFVNNNKNLYICSTIPGNGKTSWAVKILQTYFHYTAKDNYDNLKGMFVSTTDLLLKLKDFNNPLSSKYKQNLENVDLIVWDDIAVSGISQYDYTQLYNIINNRILSKKSNIFTSNVVSLKELEKILGARLSSRIYNASEIIEFKGGDMR